MASTLLAFLAGVLTVAAPCTLPVLPLLLGASIGRADRARPVFIALGFVVAFAGATLLFSAITQILGFDQNTLRDIAVFLLVAFGLMLLWPRPFEALMARINLPFGALAAGDRSGHVGGFVVGATLGLVWTPCAGPVLGSILTVIATSPETRGAALLLVVYTLGAAIPMLAIAYGGQAVTTRVRSVARISHRLQQGFGVLVIAFAVATYLQYDTALTAWLAGFYPNGQLGL
jgi:cytochrome c-type biogenesis protein